MSISEEEQLMIELVNRARLDPLGEAQRLGFSEQEIAQMGLPSGSAAALAGISQLQAAAEAHSGWMLQTDTFSHEGAGGSRAGDRIADAGYVFAGGYAWGENIGYRASSGTIDATSATYNLHRGLFDSTGHRNNMLNDNFAEIGLGLQAGDYLGYSTVMVTQNFATTASRTFLTGVAYNDGDNDDFYSVGEGVGGIRFAIGAQFATTASAGGYAMEFNGMGWQNVSITGAGVSMLVQVRFGGENVKLDLVDFNTVQSSGSLALHSGVANGVLLGLDGLNLAGNHTDNVLTGNGGANTIWGLAGNDVLIGEAGNDTLIGGFGNDTVRGGQGSDTAVLAGQSSNAQVTQTAVGIAITLGGQTDVFAGVETFQFSDAAYSFADLVNGAHLDGSGPTAAPAPTSIQLSGTNSNEMLRGASGSDLIVGGDGFDTIYAGSGADTLMGQNHADEIHGGAGNDLALGGEGFDALYGDAGEDTLHGENAADRLYGGDDDDVLYGGGNVGMTFDGLWGEAGNDQLFGNAGFDFLDGGAGNDLLDGGTQADNLFGGTGNDTLRGGDGNDRLFGGTGNDFARGGAGTDALFGCEGNDSLNGEGGADRLFGGVGNDVLDGSEGQDRLDGGAGFDRLIGGAGNDIIRGGFNADTFAFQDGHGDDVITDFEELNQYETVDLSGVSAIVNLYDLFHNHLSQVGGNVVIDTGAGNSITLFDVAIGDLDRTDFEF
ncbi:CAP domain-containing protein [Sulfitobacter aestuariivivens]|uniref:SCP domain-containing protein n=1 Tax=Sulfitobacter aestuariivivens TaxID=2766981 RepID=A0A927D6L8_9RHOB|nr:CAP domain-containing protein [Sulfitobacter aestuariivivens]MBD3666123.1 hypothetical protein [Sulfitobacter aestuariivivens]